MNLVSCNQIANFYFNPTYVDSTTAHKQEFLHSIADAFKSNPHVSGLVTDFDNRFKRLEDPHYRSGVGFSSSTESDYSNYEFRTRDSYYDHPETGYDHHLKLQISCLASNDYWIQTFLPLKLSLIFTSFLDALYGKSDPICIELKEEVIASTDNFEEIEESVQEYEGLSNFSHYLKRELFNYELTESIQFTNTTTCWYTSTPPSSKSCKSQIEN